MCAYKYMCNLLKSELQELVENYFLLLTDISS